MKTIINFILHELLVFLLGRSLTHKQCRDENRAADDQALQKSTAMSPPPQLIHLLLTQENLWTTSELQLLFSSSTLRRLSLPPSALHLILHLWFICSHSSILFQFLSPVSFYLSQCGFRPLLSSLMSTGLIRLTQWGCCSSTPPSPSPSSSSHLWFHYAWSASQHHLHLRALRGGAVVRRRGDTTHAVRWHKDISWRCRRGGCTFKNAPFTYNPLSSFRARWRAEVTGLISNPKIASAFYNPIFKKMFHSLFFFWLWHRFVQQPEGSERGRQRERGSCKSILIREQEREAPFWICSNFSHRYKDKSLVL